MARRLKWGNIEDLENKINEYFEIDPIPTIAGLCIHLDVSSEFWKYYTSNRWQTKRKSDEEIEEINKCNEELLDNEGFEDYLTIAPNVEVIDNYDACSKYDKDVETTIKRRLSALLKKTQLRFEDYTFKQIYTAKNPAGSIFTAKVAFGYRENDPSDSGNNSNIPSKITINIMPAPNADQLQQASQICIDTNTTK